MTRLRFLLPALLLSAAATLPAADPDGYVPMFNGRDLGGWVNVNCYPGTFFVKDDQIITTGHPTGYLRTDKQYENFIAEFDWMHVNMKEVGNSGFFVWCDPLPSIGTGYSRGIEVQVLVNLEYKDKKTGAITATSHGDLFSIWGATCKPDRPHPLGWARCLPSENNAKGGGEWNHYKVTANNGVMKLEVNGKEVSGLSECKPRKGYLALESEGAECHFRNLKIKELPSTNPKPDEVADVAQGHQNLLTGTDLPAWKVGDTAKNHWKVNDWRLVYDGEGDGLRTAAEYGDAEFIADFSFPKKDAAACAFVLHAGDAAAKLIVEPDRARLDTPIASMKQAAGVKPAGQWNRLVLSRKEGKITVRINGEQATALSATFDKSSKGAFELRPGGAMSFGNLFVRELK
ncbi:MAG: DUF1080 domain-containing protein [Gemmataceae bacterium]